MPKIAHKFIVDEKGQAQEVILSIETFRQIEEILGADFDEQEEADWNEGVCDSVSGIVRHSCPLMRSDVAPRVPSPRGELSQAHACEPPERFE
jgi:hypothetical protein